MSGSDNQWPHKVEIAVAAAALDGKLAEIDAWLLGWEMPHRLAAALGDEGSIRVSFQKERHARAFQLQYGGRSVDGDELQRAMAADAADDDLFEKLAREFQE